MTLDFWLADREQPTIKLAHADVLAVATTHRNHFTSHEIYMWDADQEVANWDPQFCDESKASHHCWQLLPTEWVVWAGADRSECPRCYDRWDQPLTLNGRNQLGVEYTLHCSAEVALAMVKAGILDEKYYSESELYCECGK